MMDVQYNRDKIKEYDEAIKKIYSMDILEKYKERKAWYYKFEKAQCQERITKLTKGEVQYE
jgi:hypothetical protein